MVESIFKIATDNYKCPRCGADKGMICRTPLGRKCNIPHQARTHLLTEEEIKRCSISNIDITKVLKKYRIWCTVSGGVTGYREAWLKKNDVIYETSDYTEASEKVRKFMTQMNNANSPVKFTYTVREV